MKALLTIILGIFFFVNPSASKMQTLKVSQDGRYLEKKDGKPFFWLGDTAWELIHRLKREEVDFYLKDRAAKDFNIIQTVILAELDGLNTPNAYGEKPLINNDPARINEKYFEHVDYVLKKAESMGMYIGLLPSWGDKWNLKWGEGPVIFTPENAEEYGRIVARRYLEQPNIVWILGGDRIPETDEQYKIVNAMAKGIRSVDQTHLISYHPVGAKRASEVLNEKWLDVDMFQSGHARATKEYEYVLKSRSTLPARPVINGEARYENIPDRFWEPGVHNDWLDDADVRESAYWSMLSGAAGYTYGCNDIWQMYCPPYLPTVSARTGWQEALNLPGSGQMKFMKALFESFPWQKMINDQSLILDPNPEDAEHIVCAIDASHKFIIAYTPRGKAINIDLSKLEVKNLSAWWFNPRSGISQKIGSFTNSGSHEFKPWAEGRGSDFVLVLIDENSGFKLP
ncbi:MAG: glycoside hydrolase family 140 protein [Bacteroidales bacterium]|nr:glycoside hydrolase family 140 protein [Bacteroidales bacterium]